MVCDKIAAFCPDFKWMAFQILDHIWNPEPFETIPNPDKSGFQIPTV